MDVLPESQFVTFTVLLLVVELHIGVSLLKLPYFYWPLFLCAFPRQNITPKSSCLFPCFSARSLFVLAREMEPCSAVHHVRRLGGVWLYLLHVSPYSSKFIATTVFWSSSLSLQHPASMPDHCRPAAGTPGNLHTAPNARAHSSNTKTANHRLYLAYQRDELDGKSDTFLWECASSGEQRSCVREHIFVRAVNNALV